LTPKQLAALVAGAADDIQAIDLITLDLVPLTSFTSYFVICSGRSDTQVRAIADSIIKKCKEKNCQPLGIEGHQQGGWVLVDFGDVVAHVFHTQVREHYNLEKLWSDARQTHHAKSA